MHSHLSRSLFATALFAALAACATPGPTDEVEVSGDDESTQELRAASPTTTPVYFDDANTFFVSDDAPHFFGALDVSPNSSVGLFLARVEDDSDGHGHRNLVHFKVHRVNDNGSWTLVGTSNPVRGGARLRLNTRRGGAFVVEGWANRPNTQLALTVACRDEDGTCSSAQQPGQLCGTRGVGQCADGLYCEFPAPNGDDRPAEACGAADGGGTCSRIAQFCTREYAPVCGCDDVTYGNACEAATVGASIKYNGACDVPPLTCASVLCLEGTVCEMVEVQCIRAPCYPVPECKPL